MGQTEREEIPGFCFCFLLFYSLFPCPGTPLEAAVMEKVEATKQVPKPLRRGNPSLTRGIMVRACSEFCIVFSLSLFSPLFGPADTMMGNPWQSE